MELWEEWRKMRQSSRTKLIFKAEHGDADAQRQLLIFSTAIKVETNKRLRGLQRRGLAYGKAYNNIMNYLNTELDSHRALSPKELKFDWYDISLQNNIASKFLSSYVSDPNQAREVENKRMNKLIELGIFDIKDSRRNMRKFLKFLGNEEVSASIDEYGSSDKVIEMFYDAYKGGGKSALKTLQLALLEFKAREITFDQAMERVGIKIEDYFSGRPTS